jgi:hypothetical protein
MPAEHLREWTVQVLWGVFFSLTGFGKVLCYKLPFHGNSR